MEVKSTVENGWLWRLWHGFNYFIGGSTFLLGSFVLFPFVNEYLDAGEVSAWLYTIGSFTFLLADITEWLHYTRINCPYLALSLNFFLSVTGSLLYLVGSVFFIPLLDLAWLGSLLFIIGSAVIVLSQAWKLYRSLNSGGKSVWDSIEEDESGFYVDLFAGLGGSMYFIGTFVFDWSAFNPHYLIPAVTLYSFGGLFFFGSALFMQKRYFFEAETSKDYSPASPHNTSSEL
jgi:hypothetical protein